MTDPFPSFSNFYAAVNSGRDPFPWQQALATKVVSDGWPTLLDIPTGLGKTAAIDVAVWVLARDIALGALRRQPTRIWYVVERRLLVDTAERHGRELQEALKGTKPRSDDLSDEHWNALQTVGDALRGASPFGSEEGPLHVRRLRGGIDLAPRPTDPSQPTLTCATVEMFASRFLFRGFGVSSGMRSVEAALAGTDTVVLLDEAHLAEPLRVMLEQAAECDFVPSSPLLEPSRMHPVLVSLTATGDLDRAQDTLVLTEADRVHPIIAKRLSAKKLTQLAEAKQVPEEMADRALQFVLDDPKSSCIIFCNTVKCARESYEAVRAAQRRNKKSESLVDEPLLLTGRMRNREADAVRRALLDPISGVTATRADAGRERSLIVVATQTLEVGADVSFDYLVTEASSARSLIQRFGRLNRLGESRGGQAVIFRAMRSSGNVGSPPVYGEEADALFTRLAEQIQIGPLNLDPEHIAHIVGPPADQSAMGRELLPSHLAMYNKTSQVEPTEPLVSEFFTAQDDGPNLTVSVAWRAYIPAEEKNAPSRLLPALGANELVEIPIWEFREGFKGRQAHSAGHKELPEGDFKVATVDYDGASLRWTSADRLRPGDTIVLNTTDGLYDKYGWNASSDLPVLDEARLRGPLWIDEDYLWNLGLVANAQGLLSAVGSRVPFDEDVKSVKRRCQELRDQDEIPSSVSDLGDSVLPLLGALAQTRHPWMDDQEAMEWAQYIDGLRHDPLYIDPTASEDLPIGIYDDRSHGRKRLTATVRSDAWDDWSFLAEYGHELGAHMTEVGEIAYKMARSVGLSEEVANALRLAGSLHDAGKEDPRFQRLLDPTAKSEILLAKSKVPSYVERSKQDAPSGWPRGGRHEALSVQVVERATMDHPLQDLVVHLVASHHGYGRPIIAPIHDTTSIVWVRRADGMKIDGNLKIADWTQARRFHVLSSTYGCWGLALLESILRLADHAASAHQGESK